jgi:hypothetical protein
MNRKAYSTIRIIGQGLLVAGSLGYVLHWPMSRLLLFAGLALNITALFELLGLRIGNEPGPEENAEKEAIDVPLDGGLSAQRPESQKEKWMGVLSALSLAAALVIQIVRMLNDESSIPFSWVVYAGILFILFDIARRILRGNQ